MEATEVIFAHGHENIQARHGATLEITKETHLSKEGTCIIAVSADKALIDLNSKFRKIMREDAARLTVLLEAGKAVDSLKASGSSRLIMTHPTDLVIRKSDYVCERTLAIRADKAACDLSEDIIDELKDPKQTVKVILIAKL
jgi:hypothetical protein